MVILFPAYNGVVGLPVSALLLFWAVNDRTELGEHRNGWKMNLANVLLVLLSLYFAVSSGSGILEAIVGGVST
jgi:Mn2+/Fe2+ NRAMP family transporter